jgi:hypothetical protein
MDRERDRIRTAVGETTASLITYNEYTAIHPCSMTVARYVTGHGTAN